jgi:hypothetical protein
MLREGRKGLLRRFAPRNDRELFLISSTSPLEIILLAVSLRAERSNPFLPYAVPSNLHYSDSENNIFIASS